MPLQYLWLLSIELPSVSMWCSVGKKDTSVTVLETLSVIRPCFAEKKGGGGVLYLFFHHHFPFTYKVKFDKLLLTLVNSLWYRLHIGAYFVQYFNGVHEQKSYTKQLLHLTTTAITTNIGIVWIVDRSIVEYMSLPSPKSTPMECNVLINRKGIVSASVSVTWPFLHSCHIYDHLWNTFSIVPNPMNNLYRSVVSTALRNLTLLKSIFIYSTINLQTCASNLRMCLVLNVM